MSLDHLIDEYLLSASDEDFFAGLRQAGFKLLPLASISVSAAANSPTIALPVMNIVEMLKSKSIPEQPSNSPQRKSVPE